MTEQATKQVQSSKPFNDVPGHEELVHTRENTDDIIAVDVWCRCGKSFRSYLSNTVPAGRQALTRARAAHRTHARNRKQQ